jgi:elongation factor 1-beta
MLSVINVHNADSQDQIEFLRGEFKKMAKAIITFKIMPESPEVDLEPIKEEARKIAKEAGAIGEMQVKEEPIAFGLKAVLVMAMYEVAGSDFDGIAAKMNEIEEVQSAEVAKMDLALG